MLLNEPLHVHDLSTEFQSVLSFRQQHHMPNTFDSSDIYFVCRMKALSYDIIPCKHEILRCEWRGVGELSTAPEATPMTRLVSRIMLLGLEKGFEHTDITMDDWFAASLHGKIFYRKYLC